MTAETTEKTGIEEAVEKAGSQGQLAKELGISQQAISLMVQAGFVSANHVVHIEAKYGIPRRRLINPKLRDLIETPFQAD